MIIFFFSDPATTEISTLPLPAALPIWGARLRVRRGSERRRTRREATSSAPSSRCGTPAPGHPTSRSQQAAPEAARSEEHTSELQSRQYLVCRLLLEKKKYRTALYQPRL